jgi:hypothetical protein
LVATATSATEDWLANELAKHEAEVVRLQPLVEAAQAVIGISWAEANAAHEKLVHPWFTALHINEDKIRRTLPRYTQLSNAQRERAIEMTVAEGFQNPYTGPVSDFLNLHHELERNTRQAAHLRGLNLQEGQQIVLSWHRDETLAQKAIVSHSHYLSRGYTITVRTDIEVTIK